MTKSIFLCVWQGDPVGEEKLLQLVDRIWPTWYYDKSPSKWEYACNILQCWIGALWPRMIPAAASTCLFHYLLEKMTVSPELNRSHEYHIILNNLSTVGTSCTTHPIMQKRKEKRIPLTVKSIALHCRIVFSFNWRIDMKNSCFFFFLSYSFL